MMPVALKIITKYNLYDKQDERKNHKGKIGFLGGLVIFASFYISYGICFPSSLIRPDFSHNLIMSLFAIFLLGFADDFLNYDSNRKFLVQFLVSSIFIFKSGLTINFNQIIPFIPASYALNLILTIIFISVIINSINLIDGADGLAASIGIFTGIVYSVIYLLNKDNYFATLALSLTGSLIGFLYYNKPNAKIFMGDSGSTFLGMLISIFILNFINNGTIENNYNVHQNVKLCFGIISVPILDMVRVMLTRIFKGKNPFSGDRNHLHHKLEEISLSKLYVIIFIVSINLLNFSISFNYTQNLFFYLSTITIIYSILIITINVFRSTVVNELNSYSINKNKLRTELSNNKERINN